MRAAEAAGRADKEMPRGTCLDVGGRPAVYDGFKKNRVGGNGHLVTFLGGRQEALQLKGARWAVLSRPQYDAAQARATAALSSRQRQY